MKLKIKVKVLTEGCMPAISDNGDWIDLKAAQDMEIRAAQAGVQYQECEQPLQHDGEFLL